MAVVVFGATGLVAFIMIFAFVMSAIDPLGPNPQETIKAKTKELQELRRKGEPRSNQEDRPFLAGAAPPGQHLDSDSAQNRANEDAGADGASSPTGTDASPGKAINEMAVNPNDPTLLQFYNLLYMREPINDPRTSKPAKYASLQLAEAACSQRPGIWRLPSVREFRLLTKDGRINDMFFPDYPTGAFWATPDDRVAISAAGAFDSYDGPAPPMALCVKEYTPERIFPNEP